MLFCIGATETRPRGEQRGPEAQIYSSNPPQPGSSEIVICKTRPRPMVKSVARVPGPS